MNKAELVAAVAAKTGESKKATEAASCALRKSRGGHGTPRLFIAWKKWMHGIGTTALDRVSKYSYNRDIRACCIPMLYGVARNVPEYRSNLDSRKDWKHEKESTSLAGGSYDGNHADESCSASGGTCGGDQSKRSFCFNLRR